LCCGVKSMPSWLSAALAWCCRRQVTLYGSLAAQVDCWAPFSQSAVCNTSSCSGLHTSIASLYLLERQLLLSLASEAAAPPHCTPASSHFRHLSLLPTVSPAEKQLPPDCTPAPFPPCTPSQPPHPSLYLLATPSPAGRRLLSPCSAARWRAAPRSFPADGLQAKWVVQV
jgi:hypothetical protein